MINTTLKFMRSQEFQPYEFYFVDELLFQELIEEIVEKNIEKKISTIGFIRDYDFNTSECTLWLDNSSLRINFSRIEISFKPVINNYYYLYGILKVNIYHLILREKEK
jgi:hypothetical protein